MSGICGIIALDGNHPAREQLAAMTAKLERRGPDGTHHWLGGPAALGHTLLATTPEALVEVLPLTDPETGCTVTADVRLDNREELIPALGLSGETRVIGDGELILRAYLHWDEACLDHFLGDFAFAIWDPRAQRLFCGRDQIGMRQLTYCHVPGHRFVFATEPRAILPHPDVPRRIDEGRIADFLEGLEGIDFTSTFFEEIHRLPPAHCLSLDASGLSIRRYWALEPGPQLQLGSDQAYADAFLEVFTKAVACRLRSPGPVGAMLSGGMDSNSIVAVAGRLLAAEGRGPLHTFSAVGPDPGTCVETRTIKAALTMPGIEPHLVCHAELAGDAEELIRLTRMIDEPFDGHMILPRAVYLRAHRAGMKCVLDGVGGDLVMNDGSRLARHFRQGRIVQAFREAAGLARFYGQRDYARKAFLAGLWRAYAPGRLRSLRKHILLKVAGRKRLKESSLDPGFQNRIDLSARRRIYESHGATDNASAPRQRAVTLSNTSLTVARERYDRVASSVAIEPRDPFLDLRVIAFCLALPPDQLMAVGWPKVVMRRAMAGLLPDEVRWRRGKEHLGRAFINSLFRSWNGWQQEAHDHTVRLDRYIRPSIRAELFRESLDIAENIEYFHLINWLTQTGLTPETVSGLCDGAYCNGE